MHDHAVSVYNTRMKNTINFRKLDADDTRRLLCGGMMPERGTDTPCYLVEVCGPDAKLAVVVARIERETMGGSGINMWSSRYRWVVSTTRENRDYFDTLRDAKEYILDRTADAAARAIQDLWAPHTNA